MRSASTKASSGVQLAFSFPEPEHHAVGLRAEGHELIKRLPAIAQTKDFQGVTGKITMDAQRNATKPAVVLKIVGKNTTAAASISPQ